MLFDFICSWHWKGAHDLMFLLFSYVYHSLPWIVFLRYAQVNAYMTGAPCLSLGGR